VSVVSLVDLLFTVENIYAVNLEIVPLLLVASIWYIVLVALLSVLQSRLERRLSSGYTDVGKRGKAVVDKVAMGEL
jgi:polar amino acid transport system permease protein